MYYWCEKTYERSELFKGREFRLGESHREDGEEVKMNQSNEESATMRGTVCTYPLKASITLAFHCKVATAAFCADLTNGFCTLLSLCGFLRYLLHVGLAVPLQVVNGSVRLSYLHTQIRPVRWQIVLVLFTWMRINYLLKLLV